MKLKMGKSNRDFTRELLQIKPFERNHLYQKVGQLQIEVDWLKKKTGYLG